MSEERIRDYIIVRLIGRGGMGSVYLARHVHLDTKAALKILLEHYSDDASIKKRFINEARLLSELQHSRIVLQKEFFEENGRLVLVMEYVEGRGLDRMIGQEFGPIPWEKALPLFIQVLDGIGYAHSKGIVHRDIKPANILVSIDGKVKITDLGIAKIAGQKGLTRTGTQMGTLYYESPEQIRGASDADHRSDIYSLGMTLYEMLAGRLPFDTAGDTSEFEIMNSVVNRSDHLDPRDHYPHIPEWLVKTVQRATHLSPEQRFQSCDDFRKEIGRYSKLSDTESGYWSDRVTTATPAPVSVSKPISSGTPTPVSYENSCPECRTPVKTEVDYCDSCGTSLTKECPECKGKIRWNKDFCPHCGTDYVSRIAEIEAENERKRLEDKRRKEEAEQLTLKRKQERLRLEEERQVRKEHKRKEAEVKRLRCIDWWKRHWWKLASIAVVAGVMFGVLTYLGSDAYRFREQRRDGPISGMTFSVIPAGSFMMGSPSSESNRESDEERHSVSVSSFELMTTEVTQGMWEEVMGDNPSYFSGANLPVESVSWHDCQDFIDELNDLDPDHTYRLPTEAEWEYACRAGTTTPYYWGSSMNGSYCWYADNSNDRSHPVGTKQPNDWGLYDMSGNVWEWCQDVYTSNYDYCPANGSAYTGSGSGRVRRGGSWYYSARICRSANRNYFSPGISFRGLGFRLARSAS